MAGDKPVYSLMQGHTELCEVTKAEIIEMIKNFATSLLWPI
jgi:hypothetical protein